MIGGLDVVVMPDPLRYQLPEGLHLPAGFREDFNAWAREFLGRGQSLLPEGEVWMIAGRAYMNPGTYAATRDKLGAAS